MDEKRFVVAARNSAGEKGSKKTNATLQDTWLDGAQKSSLWLCYAGPLAGRQTSRISGNWCRPKRLSGKLEN